LDKENGHPGAALKTGLDHKENVKSAFILSADGQQSVSRVRCFALSAYRIEFSLAKDPRAALGPIPRVGETSRLAGRVVMVSRSRRVHTGLHHHRFLERATVRVPIITLWQIGYTVKKCPPFGTPSLTNATKREQYSAAPSAPASGWGKSHAGSGSWGDGPYSARGRCHSDTFTYANSQSANVVSRRQQDLSIPFRPFSFTAQTLMGGKRSPGWCENEDLRKADGRAMPKPQPGSNEPGWQPQLKFR
jgi:hypothetical protein